MIVAEDLKDARYELKFNAKSAHYEHLQAWILNHSSVFRKIYEPRIINNIYFDNYDLDSFQENLSGISSRSKLRLRWYGDTFDPAASKMELKLRKSMLGWKIASEVSFENKKLSELTWTEINQQIKEQIPDDLQLYFSLSSYPVLINRYAREYFMSMDNKIRLTIDRGVQFYDQRAGARMNITRKNISPEIIILEIKVNAEDIECAKQVTGDVYLQRTKNSKYVTGVSSILGY